MADLFVVVPALLQLLGQLVLALGGGSGFTGVGGVVHHVLHPVDLGFVHTLHLVQVVHTQGADGIRSVAVEVDQCLKAVLLAAIKQPIDGPLAGAGDRVGLAVILEEIVDKVVADDLPAGGALIAQCLGNVIQVCFQRICAVHHFQPVAQAGNDIVLQIFLVCNGDHIIHIRGKGALFYAILGAEVQCARRTQQTRCTQNASSGHNIAGVDKLLLKGLTSQHKAGHIQRVAAKHTAHRVTEQTFDLAGQVGTAHGHVLVLHFRGQFVLQAVNINKDAVQFFLISFQFLKTLLTFFLPCGKFICDEFSHSISHLLVPFNLNHAVAVICFALDIHPVFQSHDVLMPILELIAFR